MRLQLELNVVTHQEKGFFRGETQPSHKPDFLSLTARPVCVSVSVFGPSALSEDCKTACCSHLLFCSDVMVCD